MQEARYGLYAQQYGRGRTCEFGPESIAGQSEWPLTLNRENWNEYLGDTREKRRERNAPVNLHQNDERARGSNGARYPQTSTHIHKIKKRALRVLRAAFAIVVGLTLGWLVFLTTTTTSI